MKFRKPQIVPLLFIVAATSLLMSLGTWQLVRLSWKNQLLADVARAQSEETLGTLPQSLDGLEYRNVVLTGVFLHEKTLREVGGKQGLPPGFFILTPFILEDDGRMILVNRGFAPKDTESKPDGLQTVRGVLRPLRGKRLFAPDNHPEQNLWFYEDIAAMSQAAGKELLPMIVEASGERQKDVFPIPSDGKVLLRNDHLGYAITWFSLALVGVIMFGLYHREKDA